MRLRLEHVDTGGLNLELGDDRQPLGARHVTVRSAARLRGLLEQGPTGLKLSDVQADEIALEMLRLVFGSVVVSQKGGATLAQPRVEFEQRPERTSLELHADVRAEHLAVEIGSIRVEGAVHIDGMCVRVRGSHGSIEAQRVTFSSFSASFGAVTLAAERLVAERLVIGWGEGFRLQAQALDGPVLRVEAGETRVRATSVELRELAVHGVHVTLGEAKIGSAGISASFTPAAPEGEQPEAVADPTASNARPLPIDWRLLDGLHGDVGVDLAVDLTVPVIGRRRATHRFRVPIESGAIDFIRLENDLSTLENTLLDFAVRDGALVLERGIPLLPTRGRGKPIIIWKLGEEDLELAQRQRVRLSVLRDAQLASAAEQPEGASKDDESTSPSSVALRRMGLGNVHARLGLASVQGALHGMFEVLRFEQLTVQGEVHHEPGGEPRPGHIDAELEQLETTVRGFPLGRNRLHVDNARLAQVSELEVSFEGLRPSTLRIELSGLALGHTELRDG
jgi:hypothetical protein